MLYQESGHSDGYQNDASFYSPESSHYDDHYANQYAGGHDYADGNYGDYGQHESYHGYGAHDPRGVVGLDPSPSSGLYGQDDRFVHNPLLSSTARRPGAYNLCAVADDLIEVTRSMGLDYGPETQIMIRSFIAALAAKPFVIFSGLAGAGKTQLASALGRWMGHGHYLLAPVRPDWTTPTSVLGEENPNSETMNSVHTWLVPRALELMLDAIHHPHDPYLLVFEEMNLAHVEQYFADILSGMESGHPVVPNLVNDGSGWRIASTTEKPYLPWPKNLYVIGTVNMDETTYTFSPKVLDRAACIEFRVPPGSLRTNVPPKRALDRSDQLMLETLLERTQTEAPSWDHHEQMAIALQTLHRMLYDVDAEFGHRSFRESLRFGAMLADCGERDVRVALDYALLYKVLPKFDNDARPREIVLRTIATFALYGTAKETPVDPLQEQHTNPVLPHSYAKVTRILRRLTYG